jgi:hypothetical protein
MIIIFCAHFLPDCCLLIRYGTCTGYIQIGFCSIAIIAFFDELMKVLPYFALMLDRLLLNTRYCSG